ncbi:MAG TPA: LysE family translocator [Caulobacteraceae bacterium]|nr:LysE family translocator [Caulobacteraceae bacterium]
MAPAVDLRLYAAFAAAVAVLMLIPGPNVALIVSSSLAHGRRRGLATVAGTASAMVLQLALVAAGLTGLLHLFGAVFGWVRWIGAAYLVWLGVRSWRAQADAGLSAPAGRGGASFRRGFVVSLTNPKTLVFYGAFFPQFLTPRLVAGPQVAALAMGFVVIALVIDSGWALAADKARPLLARAGRLPHRLSGGFLIGAGAALALARR